MHNQIREIIDDMKRAQERMHALAKRVPDDQWAVRSAPERWSISENVEHLNLFSERFIPLTENGLAQAREMGGKPPARYRRGLAGGILYRMMGPPVRFTRVKSKASFVPSIVPLDGRPAAEVRDRFDRYQHRLVSLTASADGLPIDRVRVPSPVDERIHYNLFAMLGMIARHQHRHLWQAERSISGAI